MKQGSIGYTKHFLSLAVLFALGNTCITAPVKSADKYNFLVFLIVSAISVLLCFLGYFIPINKITLPLIFLLCFYCTADTFITFVKFISNNLLPQSSRFLIILPFILILLYIAFKKTETIFKFSLVCGFLSVAVIVFFFLSTLKDFNLKNIFIYNLPSVSNMFSQSSFYFKSLILPSLLLGVFGRFENIRKGIAITGLGIGLICLAVTILNSVLLFGIQFSGLLDYPYSTAGSTVTFGNLFTRLDGFLYFLYTATCVIKCAVGIFTIKKSASQMRCR